jgi:flagellar assembly protein FliH
MSSFRIDRQYVSFQTAETQPVFAKVEVQRPKEDPPGADVPGPDISKLYDEIYERLRSENAEQAEYILQKASDDAQEIVDNAKKQAEEFAAQAKADALRFRDELAAELENAALERRCREEKEFQELEASLRSSYDGLADGMRDEVVALVMEIVRKVIGIKLSQSDDIFIGLVKEALDRLKQAGSVVIRVGPEDYARYFGEGRSPDLDTGETKTTVAEEPDFSPGDLIVESEGEIIDLSIDRQIDQIEKAFRD